MAVTQITQREGVFQAVCQVLGVSDEELKERGGVLGLVELTSEQKKKVHAILIPRFLKREIVYDEKDGPLTPERARKYVGGLTNNWLRKDKRLNGGKKYEPKNPGIRAGSGDETLRAMKNLRELLISQNKDTTEVDAAIEARKKEIELAKQPKLDPSKLPEHLRHLVPASFMQNAEGSGSTDEASNEEDSEHNDSTEQFDGEPAAVS